MVIQEIKEPRTKQAMVRQPEISKVGMNTSSQMERQRMKIVQGPGTMEHPSRKNWRAPVVTSNATYNF